MRMALFLRSTAFACAAIIAGSVLIGCSGYTSGGSTPAAPVITTQPANQTVSVGQAAAFTVAATGTPPLSYQWQKNGAAISGATSSSYATPATTAADNGAQFRVVVSNSAGSVTSSAATHSEFRAATAIANYYDELAEWPATDCVLRHLAGDRRHTPL
jgi:hypothetical protein